MVLKYKDFDKISYLYYIYEKPSKLTYKPPHYTLDIKTIDLSRLYNELLFLFNLFIQKNNVNNSFLRIHNYNYANRPSYEPKEKIQFNFVDSITPSYDIKININEHRMIGSEEVFQFKFYNTYFSMNYNIYEFSSYTNPYKCNQCNKTHNVNDNNYIEHFLKSNEKNILRFSISDLIQFFIEFIIQIMDSIKSINDEMIYFNQDFIYHIKRGSDSAQVLNINRTIGEHSELRRQFNNNIYGVDMYSIIKSFIELQCFLMLSFGSEYLNNYRKLVNEMSQCSNNDLY